MTTCPKCGSSQADGVRFCNACGTELAPAVAAGTPVGARPGGPKTSSLAVVALVLSLIPVCVWVIGLVLGIVALVRINDRPQELKGKGLAIAAIVLPVVWFFVGILAAIAVPNFIRYTARAKQTEAKATLRSIYTLERSYELDHPNQHASSLEELGFTPPPRRRYAYFYGGDARQPDLGGPYELDAATRAQLPRDTVAAAATNLDTDPMLDVWAVDSQGEVHHVVDDLTQ